MIQDGNERTMIRIDGSSGEGGGQVLRSSLALSLVTGQPFTIDSIRAGRRKPGLLRQHLTAVRAAIEVGDADAEGAALGSTRLVFRPRGVRAGSYELSVGTAGSTTLVLQTVLPALIGADGPSTLALGGGTHNPAAPPFDFLEKTYLPLVRRLGPEVRARLVRHGFYPAGGGEIRVEIEPSELSAFSLLQRGEIRHRRARAVVANLPERIAERELATIREKTGWDAGSLESERVTDSPGPGNYVAIEVVSEHLTEVFTAFGEKGIRAETVAERVVRAAKKYLAAEVPVGIHLADQLLLLLAIAGRGSFCTMPLSRHAETQMEVVSRFLDVTVTADEIEEGRAVEVTVS